MAGSTGPTWMVLVRDISHAVRINGEPRLVATLILDADTGLVRGLSVGHSESESCSQAMGMALTQPAGSLPPGPPDRVLCGIGYRSEVATALRHALRGELVPAVTEVVSAEAEDIFDSFLGHLSGRRQPAEFATTADWRLLFEQAADYAQDQPWLRRGDHEHMDLVVRVEELAARYVAIVIGHEAVQRGLVLYPGGALPVDLQYWQHGAPAPVPPGTLLYYLDPPDQAPQEFFAKAVRYNWPAGSELVPVWLVAGPDGPTDLDQLHVRRFTVAIAAVLAYERNSAAKTTGEVALADGRSGTFSIS